MLTLEPAGAVAEIRRGRLRNALRLLTSASSPHGQEQHVVVAELQQLTGANQSAATEASRLLASARASSWTKARAHQVLAAVAIDQGQFEIATSHLYRALNAARDAGDLAEVCRVQLRLIPSLSDLGQFDTLSTLLSEVRHNVFRTGDAQLLTQLHLRFGQLEAKRGLLDRARRHLDLGLALVKDDPNVWLEGLLCLDASAVAVLASEVEEAKALATRALSCSEQSGHTRTGAASLVNLCVLCVHDGELQLARSYAEQGLDRASGFERLRLALLDNLAQVDLLAGKLAEAEESLSGIAVWSAEHPDVRQSWFYLSAYQTRIRLESRRRLADSAQRLAWEATALADARSDRLLGALFRAMQADSLVVLGRPDDAGRLVAEAQAMVNGASLATLAEIERVRATVHASLGEQDAAADHFHRAVRLLTSVGSFLAKREAAQAVAAWLAEAVPDSRGNGGQAVSRAPSGTLDWPPAPLQVHQAPSLDAMSVESLAALFPYASKPGVLGREVVALLARLDCASTIELRVHQPDGRDEVLERRERGTSTAATAAVDIDVGTLRGRPYLVRVVPCRRVGARGAVTAVKQLAESAVALETARREEKERTSLWPGDVDLEDAGGLFVSGVMRELLANAHRVAASNVPVLLTGESGVGKEVIAREIHRRSPYAKGPFVPFNCTAAPRDVLDSQLFGHRRGAFTGALEHAPGVIRAAQGGTLFLDEIGELDHDSQPKLLRFLDSKEVFPIGETRPVHVDVRVIAATNARLEQLLAEGRFREDLYYRLAIAPLHVPPLRERREEIPAFVNHFLDLYAREAKRAPLDVTEEALEYLVLYRWPGNVRQLAAEMRRVALMTESGGTLTPELLSTEIRASRRTVDAAQPLVGPNEVLVRIDQPLQASLDQIERAAIERALGESQGRVEKAAGLLRISRKGLFLKRRRLGLPIAER